MEYQGLVRRVPVTDNVMEYAVKLVGRTRPGSPPTVINDHVSWGAGPRASQYLVVGAKAHALARGDHSPDIADVQAVALPHPPPSLGAELQGRSGRGDRGADRGRDPLIGGGRCDCTRSPVALPLEGREYELPPGHR